jgi:hypothetical protein
MSSRNMSVLGKVFCAWRILHANVAAVSRKSFVIMVEFGDKLTLIDRKYDTVKGFSDA